MYRQRLNSGEVVHTDMKRLCSFAVSHIVTHYYAASHWVARSVSLNVCLSVCHSSEPCKNSWNDQVAICVLDTGGPSESRITCGPDANMGRDNFEGETDKPLQSVATLRGHLWKHSWTDRGAVCVVGLHGSKASCVTWEVQIPHGKGQVWWIAAPIVNYRHFLS